MTHTADKQRISPLGWIAMLLGAAVLGYIAYYHIAVPAVHGGAHEAPPLWQLGTVPFVGLLGCIAILPLLPATHHWWESNLNRLIVALGCAAATLIYFILAVGWHKIMPVLNHAIAVDYIPFIILLFSLYVISGGISLKGDLAAHPSTNTAFIAFGAIIASFIGTTGASMLLIRPLLQTNSERRHVVHTVVFFIFLVSNIGGCLLPIGDPPLFLGYLRGVSFFWTFNLWPQWATCCVILLVMYFLLDSYFYKKETPADIKRDETERQPLRLKGAINILWLACVVACVAKVNPQSTLIHQEMIADTTVAKLNGSRGVELGAIAITDSTGHTGIVDLAGAHTIGEIRDRISAAEHVDVTASIQEDHLVITSAAGGVIAVNEAAALPADEHEVDGEHAEDEAEHGGGHATNTAHELGIAGSSETGIITGTPINPGWTPFPFCRELMMLALVVLSLASTPRGVREANNFNYAAILEVAALFVGIFIAMQVPIEVLNVMGDKLGLTQPWHFFWATGSLSAVLDNAPTYVVFFETANALQPGTEPVTVINEVLLVAISLGAVFMGAMTYIGNGPNFMVKAIAEQSGIQMPSFFGYVFKYSIPFLIPVFLLITIIFLRGGSPIAAAANADAHGETPAAHVETAGGEHGSDHE